MIETTRTDIEDRKEFTFEGDTLKMMECYDKEKHIYIYKRFNADGRLIAYEVVNAKKHKNPSGETVFMYPSTEQFGRSAYFVAKKHAYGERGIYYYAEKLAQQGQKLEPSDREE